MLFISILLSVWFVAWLIYAIFIKDVCKLFVSWMDSTYEDDEDVDSLLENPENKTVYHLSCDHCNHIWWSTKENDNFCPNCGKKPHKEGE